MEISRKGKKKKTALYKTYANSSKLLYKTNLNDGLPGQHTQKTLSFFLILFKLHKLYLRAGLLFSLVSLQHRSHWNGRSAFMQVGAVPSFLSLSLCSYPNQSYYYLQILTLLLFFVPLLSHVQLFAAPWTAAHQASLSSTISWSLPKFMSIWRGKIKILHNLLLLLPLYLSLLLAKSGSHRSQKMGTHYTRTQSLSHSPLSCSLQSPRLCKPANLLNHACPCVKIL